MEFVSWNYDIPKKILESHKIPWHSMVPNHQQDTSYGYGSKLGTPKLWMVNTKLDISICGPLGLPFRPTSIYTHHIPLR